MSFNEKIEHFIAKFPDQKLNLMDLKHHRDFLYEQSIKKIYLYLIPVWGFLTYREFLGSGSLPFFRLQGRVFHTSRYLRHMLYSGVLIASFFDLTFRRRESNTLKALEEFAENK